MHAARDTKETSVGVRALTGILHGERAARGVLVLNRSVGGDMIIARDTIAGLDDLRGKRVALELEPSDLSVSLNRSLSIMQSLTDGHQTREPDTSNWLDSRFVDAGPAQ